MPMLQRVWSKTSEKWIRCNWFECDKDGFEQFKMVVHDHSKLIPCDHYLAEHVNYIFCSERHLNYYVESPRNHFNLPAGKKTVF